MTALADVRLPAGFVARFFRDEDRETLVALHNHELHPLQQESAAEWRHWESVIGPDPTAFRVVIETLDRGIAAGGRLTSGHPTRFPDGAVAGGVWVAREYRGRGIGSALLAALEVEARRRAAPKFTASVNERNPRAVPWAERRGFKEIGRRLGSYVDLTSFEAGAFGDAVERLRTIGLRVATLEELLAERDDHAREALYREMHEADAEAWQDIPFPSPVPHLPYESYRRLLVESGRAAADASVLALDGESVVGLTLTGLREGRDGVTIMTGTRRAYRGRGVAFGLKVEALARAKARGLRALVTANDEPNTAMLGINRRLGYQPLPAQIVLQKRVA